MYIICIRKINILTLSTTKSIAFIKKCVLVYEFLARIYNTYISYPAIICINSNIEVFDTCIFPLHFDYYLEVFFYFYFCASCWI